MRDFKSWLRYWTYRSNWRYEMKKRVERLTVAFVWRLPSEIIKWSVIRMWAHATTGHYGDTIASDITVFKIAERWDTALGGDRRRCRELFRKGYHGPHIVKNEDVERALDERAFAAKYPESVKMRAAQGQGTTIGEFLDWCSENNMLLASYGDSDRLWPITEQVEMLLRRYLGIDSKKFDAEQRAMLAELRAAQETEQ
ncbi:MAG TPA: hypothetical protein VIG47_02570 [Gemmatimonadaceae bacterium]|jgi:hypothetical protein